MALISKSKGRNENDGESGYERLFGNHELGQLLSRVHATVISSGTELEKIIVELSKTIDNVDVFINQKTLPNGIYLITKKAVKKSSLCTDREPDLLIFEIAENKQHCYIIELKDGDTFDTKKAKGEVENLKHFENHVSRKLKFTTSIHICSFNQPDKEKIIIGFKKQITSQMAMTGNELCNLIGLNYKEIVSSRVGAQNENLRYFIESILNIDAVKKISIDFKINNYGI